MTGKFSIKDLHLE